MANGFRCVNCGWQETNHDHGPLDSGDPDEKDGFPYSLKSCPFFKLSEADTKKNLEINKLAQEAEKRRSKIWR